MENSVLVLVNAIKDAQVDIDHSEGHGQDVTATAGELKDRLDEAIKGLGVEHPSLINALIQPVVCWHDYEGIRAKIEYIRIYLKDIGVHCCNRCNAILTDEEAHIIEGRTLCDDCFNEYYAECDECHEFHRRYELYTTVDGKQLCSSCFEKDYVVCCNCGSGIPLSEAHADSGDFFCDDCYIKHLKRAVIHSYHDEDVEYHLNKMNDETGDEFTIGIEHEIAGDTSFAWEFAEMMNGEYTRTDNVVLMRDSSVAGFEIVSQPMTLRYFNEVFLPKYEQGLQYLKNRGFEGENEGGIHIHFTRIEDVNQRARLINVLYGTVDDEEIWCKITRRTRDNLREWASVMDRRWTTNYIVENNRMTATRDRHTALNYDDDRTFTHELRIFNSTADLATYISCVDVLLSLLDFTKENRTPRGLYVTSRDYVEFILENKDEYPRVHELMMDQGVYRLVGLETYDMSDEDELMNEILELTIEEEELA